MNSGQIVKKHRLKKKMTLEDVSKLTSLSTGYLSKLERSDRIPPFATLQTLSRTLDFDMTTLLNSQIHELNTEGDQDILILRKANHEITKDGVEGYFMTPLTISYKNTAMSPFKIYIFPGQTKDFKHDAEEFLYVIEGSVKIVYKGSIYPLNEGDSVYFDSRNVHSFINESEQNALLLSINHVYRKF
jgi:transcriptional regulator with XRE-family HTH domain